MILLKQSTAATLRLGPFMDATDGVTPETGVTLGAADQAEILKATGATVDISGATFAAITGAGGWYDLSLTTSHTDTLGMLTVVVQDTSVCLPVFARAMVVPANVWDSLVGGTDLIDASVVQWAGTAVATPDTAGYVKSTLKTGTGAGEVSITSGVVSANTTQLGGSATPVTNLAAAAQGIVPGTVDTAGFSPTTTEFETSLTEATADHYNGRLVIFRSGALAGQQTLIQDYALASGRGHFTVVAMTEAPGNGDTFAIV
jgi:hypothetical protein